MSTNNKYQKREQLRKNIAKGKAGELEARVMYNLSGYSMEKLLSPGPDFKATKRNIITGDIISEKTVEVKTGKSKIRESQKKADKVYRTNAFPHNLL
jgi:hypothetical protein